MFHYQLNNLQAALEAIIRQNVSADVWNWLQEKKEQLTPQQFNTAFAMMPRKTGKSIVQLSGEQEASVQSARPGFVVRGWSIDRLCRVWLLLQLDANSKEAYFHTIEKLFPAGEMQELVALYSALPVLAYPEMWRNRCSEGMRSNIGSVLEAIMCNNPYPSENLPEAAWNQLVLKAFFTEKPIHQIIGLDHRANAELAKILSDYAHERWAAHRLVNPQLWRCVGPFINETILPDIEKLYASGDTVDKEAAALACHESQYAPAQELLAQHADLKFAIEGGSLTWDSVAKNSMHVHN